MKIFDCFMYFDEDLILDIRLNTLDKFVDYFVYLPRLVRLRATSLSISRSSATSEFSRHEKMPIRCITGSVIQKSCS